MQYVLIIHEVADYTAWKQVFDDAAEILEEAGELSYQVLKYEAQPNKIVHFSAWTSIADAKAFFESERLIEIRKQAGVKAPEFIYLEQLECGSRTNLAKNDAGNVETVSSQIRVFDHIDLRVRNLADAKSFYDQLMPHIGFPNSYRTSHGIAYEATSNHPKPEFVGLVEDPKHHPSATRIAFWAPTKEAVERTAEKAILVGAKNLEGPMYCPEYSPSYYALFFDDPCGNHLEVCCRTAL